MTSTAARVDLTLISHTNAGKTTLARTLLRKDVGEVGDRAHVTDLAESHVLIESPEGDSLVLWDTPGFGDSARLFKRLQKADQPVGWFLSQVWDRFADRPFWCGQQAMRNVRDASDVILYVANASEQPSTAAYLDIEMQFLEWLGKPVILLLNQLGAPREEAHLRTEVKEWELQAARHPCVRAVLPLDAFARCWVQEGTLLGHVQRVLCAGKQAPFERLREAWQQRNLRVFEHSMQVLARQIAVLATDSEPIVDLDVRHKARAWIGALTGGEERGTAELRRAQTALAARLDEQVRAATEDLVRLHGLSGKATREVLQGLGPQFSVRRPADADKASVLGGLVSGALGGLAADLGAGGLTFGAGALIGGVLGAFGARGLTKAYNVARGELDGMVRWSSEFLESRTAAALMRYLVVAHFGRGRGDFVTGLAPAHWQETVNEAVQGRLVELQPIWANARTMAADHATTASSAALLPIVAASAREVLGRLYRDTMPAGEASQWRDA
ncbi:MAG: DUF3482 domain-containing protein [Gammaproteobacteria bacterium]